MDIKEHATLTKNLMRLLNIDENTELIETHISTIILSGDLVYKLKKPVDFGFLDYSTLQKRYKNCLEEVRINRGYAPKLYLGVIPITGSIDNPQINGEGEVLDYAVKMYRFEQSDQLDNIVEQNTLEIEFMDKIAKIVANFHEVTAPVDATSDYGEPQKVLSPMLENFELLQAMIVDDEFDSKLISIKRWTYEQFDKLKDSLQHRKSDGFIRECHGDMHLHNMALHDGELILFDAIEFNTYLNHIDVISDLSFLLMDLEHRGLYQHSRRVLNYYIELSGDYSGLALLNFYKTYRAMVRAKVVSLRVAQEMEENKRIVLMDEMIKYVDLALSYTEIKDQFLAITHGFSGSGKSTCALMMVEMYGAVRIRSDVERMRMFNIVEKSDKTTGLQQGIYTADITRITYSRLLELAKIVIDSGSPVVLDATFLKLWQRQLFFKLSEEVNLPFLILDLECDIEAMRYRIKKRSSAAADISEADLDVLEMQMHTAEVLLPKERENKVSVDCSTIESMENSINSITYDSQ
jgi:aminoglycoside phosphotransferase family enzyme/gluconate kinase